MGQKRRQQLTAKTTQEILELKIDAKLAEAKETLRQSNQADLKKIAGEEHHPRLKKVLSSSGVIIAFLIVSNLWAYLGVKDRIKSEANRIIDQKLIDPQLTNTLEDALSRKAIPYIKAQVAPVEQNVSALKTTVENQKLQFLAISIDASNKQSQLSAEQHAIHSRILPLSKEIDALKTNISTAQAEADQLQEEEKLMSLMNRAEIFDRDAFDKLQESARGTNINATFAKGMISKVQRTLILDRGSFSYVVPSETDGRNQYSGPYTSDELAIGLLEPLPDGYINLISDQKFLVPELVDLAHKSKDLWTVNRIANALKKLAGVDFYPWDLAPLDSWWKQESINYTNWPSDQFKNGMSALRSCRYDHALTNFENVLAKDPKADKSRAMAVACATEIGDFSLARRLLKDFAAPDERWSKWAQGKMMLATNAVKEGTGMFVSLSKQYPTLIVSGFISQGNHIVRQIDWQTYSNLMQQTTTTARLGNK